MKSLHGTLSGVSQKGTVVLVADVVLVDEVEVEVELLDEEDDELELEDDEELVEVLVLTDEDDEELVEVLVLTDEEDEELELEVELLDEEEDEELVEVLVLVDEEDDELVVVVVVVVSTTTWLGNVRTKQPGRGVLVSVHGPGEAPDGLLMPRSSPIASARSCSIPPGRLASPGRTQST